MKSADSLWCAALMVTIGTMLLWPAAGQAQVPNRDRPQPQRPDLTFDPPELEIYRQRLYDDEIREGDELRLVVGVANNGELPGSFDYALGPENMRSVWGRSAGTNLNGDDTHIGWFRLSHMDLLRHLGTSGGGGLREVCLSVFLLEDGTSDRWTDADNDNHRQRICFDYWFPPQ